MEDFRYRAIHGVSGIWTKKGNNNHTTDLLLKDLEEQGFLVSDINYPKMGALAAYSTRREKRHAYKLLNKHTDGDVAIGHSRGALVVWRACLLGAKFSKIILFSPAMDDDLPWPPGCAEEIIIVHEPRDRALAFGRWLPFHRFGTLGKHGYRGPKDDRITHVNAEVETRESLNYEYDWLYHSHYFRNLNIWTPKVIQWISYSPKL